MRLHLESVCKSFGSKKILHHLNLTLDQPGIWALIAPNGSGKTTLLDCIANLQTIDAGSITVLGHSNKSSDIYQNFAYLQDNRILYPELTGLEHLYLLQKIHKLPRERVEEVIATIGIEAYVFSPVKSYSLGMKQHLLLALAILNKPTLLLLDEPLNGLDPTSYIKTRTLLQQLAEDGTTIILSSHQLSEVDQLTNKLLFLKDGAIIQKELVKTPSHYRIQTSNSQFLLQTLKLENGLQYVENHLLVDTSLYPLNHLLKNILTLGIEILHIEPFEMQSENVYKDLFES